MGLYRSWMFVPGADSKKIEKVQQLPVDVIIYDLEDAVANSKKESARIGVREALQNNQTHYNVVRVNSVDTPYFEDDVKEIISNGLHGIMLPKSETKEQLLFLEDIVRREEERRNLKHTIEIIPLIESALGVHNAEQIASASRRVKCLAFGSVDYVLDIGAELTKEGDELLYARSHLVNVSRVAGIQQPIDAVYIDFNDLEGLKKETKLVKSLGFQGKLIIHPKQIVTVNNLFSPSIEEVEHSKNIVEAYEESIKNGLGAVQVNGKMVDYPVVERAKKLLEKNELIESLIN